MADNNDDFLDTVPEPEAEPTAAERAHAKTFADLVDKTIAGRTPAAMTTDDRALIEVATVIRAAAGNAPLDAARKNAVVEAALRQAVGGAGATATTGSVVSITRGRARRWAPWAIAATSTLVAAAALILWLRAPSVVTMQPAAQTVPETWKSRPADPLIGPITKEHVGDASARIDTIFADRLDGYRELRLRGRKP